jgi:hypothetical protein
LLFARKMKLWMRPRGVYSDCGRDSVGSGQDR